MASKSDITVSSLVDMIDKGDLRLPSIQRRYVWPATRVRDLLDSLYRGYPSGSILVWETDEEIPEKDMAVPQAPSAFRSHKLLLDGQQRLTSLSAITKGQPLKLKRVRPIEIAFNLDHPEGPPTETTEVEEEAEDEDEDEGAESPTLAAEPPILERLKSLAFVVSSRSLRKDPHWIPVSKIFDSQITDWQLLKPLGLTPDQPEWDKYTRRLQRVRSIRDYPYVMHVLERGLSYEEVTEIFVRVNSLGMKLRSSDLALAQITARWPEAVQLFEDFAEECEKVWFTFDLGLLVRTVVVFATHQSRFRSVSRIRVDDLKTAWTKSTAGLQFAVNFLRANAGIEDESLLSSPFLVIPVAVFAQLRDKRLSSSDERALLHWLFAANALGHYSGSSETTLDKDLSVLFADGGPEQLLELLRQQRGRLRFESADFAGRSERNPLFQTTYLALRQQGAKDWFTGLGVSLTHQGRYHYVEAHHIFPRALMAKKGYDKRLVNEIANLAFLGGGGNRKIGAKGPEQYFPQIVEKRSVKALESQAVPIDPDLWKPENFERFLQVRRTALAQRVNAFLDTVSKEGEEATLDLGALLEGGENEQVEFKEGARVNRHTGNVEDTVKRAFLRAVAGMWNGSGGTIVLGVRDDAQAVGIRHDLESLKDKSPRDGHEQYLRNSISQLGKLVLPSLKVSYHDYDGVQVCAVRVAAGTEPVWLNEDGTARFFVRAGNTTQLLQGADQATYLKTRFS
jgi:hypothetical protein